MSVFARATGIGSWPGVAARQAAEVVVGELHNLPHLGQSSRNRTTSQSSQATAPTCAGRARKAILSNRSFCQRTEPPLTRIKMSASSGSSWNRPPNLNSTVTRGTDNRRRNSRYAGSR